jgi:uncharacterized membrane protein
MARLLKVQEQPVSRSVLHVLRVRLRLRQEHPGALSVQWVLTAMTLSVTWYALTVLWARLPLIRALPAAVFALLVLTLMLWDQLHAITVPLVSLSRALAPQISQNASHALPVLLQILPGQKYVLSVLQVLLAI